MSLQSWSCITACIYQPLHEHCLYTWHLTHKQAVEDLPGGLPA